MEVTVLRSRETCTSCHFPDYMYIAELHVCAQLQGHQREHHLHYPRSADHHGSSSVIRVQAAELAVEVYCQFTMTHGPWPPTSVSI